MNEQLKKIGEGFFPQQQDEQTLLERKVLDAVAGHDADDVSEVLLLTYHRINGYSKLIQLFNAEKYL